MKEIAIEDLPYHTIVVLETTVGQPTKITVDDVRVTEPTTLTRDGMVLGIDMAGQEMRKDP